MYSTLKKMKPRVIKKLYQVTVNFGILQQKSIKIFNLFLNSKTKTIIFFIDISYIIYSNPTCDMI